MQTCRFVAPFTLVTALGAGCGQGAPSSEQESVGSIASELTTTTIPCARAFAGYDPFSQPAPTTDYYGSGDVNLDGEVTQQDVDLAQAMASGTTAENSRADVDASGAVDQADVTLLSSAAAGAILPGWWDRLPSRTEREAWLSKVLALDTSYLYKQALGDAGLYVCGHYAQQAMLIFSYYGCDLTHSMYNGNGTHFNLPMYRVIVASDDGTFGHSINAILLGDNPLEPADWVFIEPQGNVVSQPGSWSIPVSSRLGVMVNPSFLGGSSGLDERIVFHVEADSSITFVEHHPELVTSRPAAPTPVVAERSYYNPRFVPSQSGFVLYDSMRDDLSRATDVHQAELNALLEPELDSAKPLINDEYFSRLLDVHRAPDGQVHLLWSGKRLEPWSGGGEAEVPGLFYSTVDVATGTIGTPVRIGDGIRFVDAAKIRIAENGTVHLFWLQGARTSGRVPIEGIYRTTVNGASVQPPQLVMETKLLSKYQELRMESGGVRERLAYVFDAVVAADGSATVLWVDGKTPVTVGDPPVVMDELEESPLRVVQHDGTTTSPAVTLEEELVRGVQLERDAQGQLYAVYWKAPTTDDRRGTLWCTVHDGSAWSAPFAVDAGTNASSPSLAPKPGGGVYVAWERDLGSQVVPVLTSCTAAGCDAAQVLQVRPGADAWYPKVVPFAGLPTVTWSSRSEDAVLIGLYQEAPELGDVNASGAVDIIDALLIAQHYVGLGPDPFVLSAADVNCSETVDIVDALLVAQYYVGLIPEFSCRGVFLESDGRVVMEAESFDVNEPQGEGSPGGEHTWELVSDASASGQELMVASPNNGTLNNTGYEDTSPHLDFQVDFRTPGTYYVWVRGTGANGDDDSCHAGLDHTPTTTADRISNFSTSGLSWSRRTMDREGWWSYQQATVTVEEPAIRTVNIWMREDGFKIDKVILTTDANYTPSGTGPEESPRSR